MQESCKYLPTFLVVGLTLPGIEAESIASVADALATLPLIDLQHAF